MAATLAELRAALASTLEDALSNVNVYAYPPDDVTVPAVVIGGFQLDPATFGDTTARVEADVQFVVSRRHVDQVQALDEWLSPTGTDSVWSIFDDDPTLGGDVGYCSVTQAGSYEQLVIADVGYYAATVSLSIVL